MLTSKLETCLVRCSLAVEDYDMGNSVQPLLSQLKNNLKDIQSYLSQAGMSERDYERIAAWGPGHDKSTYSQLIFWRFRLEQLIYHVESCLAPGKPEPLYMLEVLRMVLRQTTFRMFAQDEAVTKVPVGKRNVSDTKAEISKLSPKELRKFRDGYISRRDEELEKEKFRGNRSRCIASELNAMGVAYSGHSTVARQLAIIHKGQKK
jgi:hypothetical protein